jgi:hypothetical protein
MCGNHLRLGSVNMSSVVLDTSFTTYILLHTKKFGVSSQSYESSMNARVGSCQYDPVVRSTAPRYILVYYDDNQKIRVVLGENGANAK